ncbi:MAG: cytochrome c3 family protein [Candidatus Sumerlaeia bacterium]
MQAALMLAAAGAARAANAPQTIDPAKGCMTGECHQNIAQLPYLHGPSNLGQCQPCHVPQGNRHQFEPAPKGKDLCQMCHESEAAKPVVHTPFGLDCQMCHNPHGADNRSYVVGGTGEGLCKRCHTDVKAGKSFLHGPVSLGECLACHTPHQSDFENLLVDAPGKFCTGCHVDFAAKLEGAVSIHEPAKGRCTGCHDPHGGGNRFFTEATGRDLCQKCHATFLQQIDQFPYQHKPMTEGKTCANCHDMHASNQVKLLADNAKAICLQCHNAPIKTAERTLPNIAAQLEKARFLHGPLRQDNCVACHDAHGSANINILDKPFPSTFYTAYEDEKYDLCFECHDKKQVMAEQSKDTNFRNGDLNLHYLHVHRDKGRSCRACHHEHASSQPHHIRSEVPFGRWTMKIEYTATENGGTCATGCHVRYGYDRVIPVDNHQAANP